MEVNDGKGCNVRQGYCKLYPLLVANLFKDYGFGPLYPNIPSGRILAKHHVPPDTNPKDDPEPHAYCGLTKVRPKRSFNPY